MTLRCASALMAKARNGRQFAASDGSGLFWGGTQRTALAIAQETSESPSAGEAAYAPRARPDLIKVLYRSSPAKSPVKGRPVRFAPRSPGARPTISSLAPSAPKRGTGALCQSGLAALNELRKAARRGQSGQSRKGSAPFTAGACDLRLTG